MRCPGHTPLDDIGIADDHSQLLRSLWIDSIEEAVAAHAAIGSAYDSPVRAGLETLAASPRVLQAIAPERLAQLYVSRQGGRLGCLLEERTQEEFRRTGRLRPARAEPSGIYDAPLPDAVRLLDRMSTVRNQGRRGTCVAFGAVALREFLLDSQIDLSEQFLYWACKELDGHPGPGTYIHTAMTALARYGVCEESVWRYNPEPIDDEGQGPATDDARSNARQYQLAATRTVEPNLVMDYKQVLAGQHGQGGMPVTFGTFVFNSWYMSSETHRTGKITLPLPSESPAGGHAWCIVGYMDDPDVPGGGYFIVRNSWGESWAADSPEAPGHALMPYEYIARYAFEAFTGPLPAHRREEPVAFQRQTPSDQATCRRVLSADDREELDLRPRAGRLLKAGTPILVDPLAPQIFREATPENEEQFRRRDCTWTDDSWRQVWFQEPARFSADTSHGLEAARIASQRFFAAIDQNLQAAVGTPFPDPRTPWWLYFVPFDWTPRAKIRSVAPLADLSDLVATRFQQQAGSPEGLDWPSSWRELLAGLNQVRVDAVKAGGRKLHVVSAFLTPITAAKQADPAIVPLDASRIALLHEIYSAWRQFTTLRSGYVTFLNLGTSGATYVHVPNVFVPVQQARAEQGRKYQVPGPELLPWQRLRQLGFDYLEVGPPGWEHLAVLISDQPLIAEETLRRAQTNNPFLKLTGDEIAEFCDNLERQPNAAWTSAVCSFLVE